MYAHTEDMTWIYSA